MIAVRMGAYTQENMQFLRTQLILAFEDAGTFCDRKCTRCPNRIPCNDMYEVIRYLDKKIEESAKA